MSETRTTDVETKAYEPSRELLAKLDRVRRIALIVAIAGAALCVLGAALNPAAFLRSYLMGFVFWISVALGCSALLMLQYVIRSGWGLVIRRTLEAAARTIPALAIFFIPILIGVTRLYPWADAAHADEVIRHKAPYLNVPFFIGRAVLYFAVWSGFTLLLSRMGRARDKSYEPELDVTLRRTSALGLLGYFLTMTFAAVDWLMSLSPHWFSTIYGVYVIGGQAVSAMAFIVIAALYLSRSEPMASALRIRHFHDYGKLLLAFVMLWAYFNLSQFLIIWSGNLPEETPWYLDRIRHGFRWISLALVILHFALPFMLLLTRDLKRRPSRLAIVAGLLLAGRLLDLYWLIAPSTNPERITLYFTDIAAPVALGGVFLWLFAGELKRRPLLPASEPALAEALSDG